jgi:hypothetical protein
MKRIFILAFLLAMAPAVSAQSAGFLLGTLHENGTMAPLAGADIRIMAVALEHEFKTTTDDKGRFAYLGLLPGRYIVTVTKNGYAAIDVFDMVIERGETTRLALVMTPADRAPFKRQMIHYRRPLINMEDASIKFVYRAGH